MSGYSGTPLLKKLGIKPGMNLTLINPADTLTNALKAEGISFAVANGHADCPVKQDYIHLFTKKRAILELFLPALKKHLKPAGMIWVSWPKQASKVPTEVYENEIRAIGLSFGLVDIKSCAVDDIWSGLKFVIPVKDRK